MADDLTSIVFGGIRRWGSAWGREHRTTDNSQDESKARPPTV